MNSKIAILVACTLGGLVLFAETLRAQEMVPQVTNEIARHLDGMVFEPLVEGIEFHHSTSDDGRSLRFFRVERSKVQFKIELQTASNGIRADEADESAILALNGGFFSKTASGALASVGYLRHQSVRHSKGWMKAGGYLAIDGGEVRILPTNSAPIPDKGDVVQSKPVLIEPGGKWAMNRNRRISKPRTIVCELDKNTILLAIISGRAMTLYEAGWLMRSPEVGGVFGCNSAIAMDGGGSTQLWVKDHPELGVSGKTAVHNLITVSKYPE